MLSSFWPKRARRGHPPLPAKGAVAGRLRVDEGARQALQREGASLLAVGIVRCEGRFAPGDGIEIVGADGVPFAKGIASASSDELRRRPRGLEAVHRDRLVLY